MHLVDALGLTMLVGSSVLLPSFFMCEIMGYDIRPTKPTHLTPCLLVLSPKLFISLRTFWAQVLNKKTLGSPFLFSINKGVQASLNIWLFSRVYVVLLSHAHHVTIGRNPIRVTPRCFELRISWISWGLRNN